jgi:hypothetical protein
MVGRNLLILNWKAPQFIKNRPKLDIYPRLFAAWYKRQIIDPEEDRSVFPGAEAASLVGFLLFICDPTKLPKRDAGFSAHPALKSGPYGAHMQARGLGDKTRPGDWPSPSHYFKIGGPFGLLAGTA